MVLWFMKRSVRKQNKVLIKNRPLYLQRRPPQKDELRVDNGNSEGAECPEVSAQQPLPVAAYANSGRRLEEDEAAQGQRRLGRCTRP